MGRERTAVWIDEIEELTGLYRARFGNLDADELNWKPAPDAWSVGQVLDHLIRTNESYFPLLEGARADDYRPPLHGRLGFVARFLGRLILKAVRPEATRKVRTMPAWEPTESDVSSDVVERFVRHQGELADVVRGAADLVERGVVIPSPASRLLVYDVGSAFDILVAHERRHLGQATEVRDLRADG